MVRGAPHLAASKANTLPCRPEATSTSSTTPAVATTPGPQAAASVEVREFIEEITADLRDLENFYNISFSRKRTQRIGEYLVERFNEIVVRFRGRFDDELDQQGKVDWLLLRTWATRRLAAVKNDWETIDALKPLLDSWTPGLIDLCERRQAVRRVEGQEAAGVLASAARELDRLAAEITEGKFGHKVDRALGFRTVKAIQELEDRLTEWFGFYKDYDPLFTWWVSKPWEEFPAHLRRLASAVSEKFVGVKLEDKDAIIGLPSGRENILADLSSEIIPYSPEELVAIGEHEYRWCEKEMIKASQELGYGKDWRKALEYVKTLYVEPGEQAYLAHELADEAVKYVTKHDMVTVPEVANETWRTFMSPAELQKVNPFFLGGDSIIVSYPTSEMTHEEKLMSMRGNSRPFSRSTVFHELIPGHRLQFHYMARSRKYRSLFRTPFWLEGWSFYWEMILWDRGFPATPEDRIGMLFWRMHRCARIVFSLKFHLGQMTPQECVDYLVEKVGHERATAEGEVRRSFNGEWTPLYQAGYMLGALQLYALRREVVEAGKMTEKAFHDRILQENAMPIEMVRALLKKEKLTADHHASWKFYGDVDVR